MQKLIVVAASLATLLARWTFGHKLPAAATAIEAPPVPPPPTAPVPFTKEYMAALVKAAMQHAATERCHCPNCRARRLYAQSRFVSIN